MKKQKMAKTIIGFGIWIIGSIPLLRIGISMPYDTPILISGLFTLPGGIGLLLIPYVSFFYCITVITRKDFSKKNQPLKYDKRTRKIAKIAMILNIIVICGHLFALQNFFNPPREPRIDEHLYQLPTE